VARDWSSDVCASALREPSRGGCSRRGREGCHYYGHPKQQVSPTVINSDGSARGANPWVINESGLYSLILRSRKPHAKAFKKWVTNAVLPAIRIEKCRHSMTTPEHDDKDPDTPQAPEFPLRGL